MGLIAEVRFIPKVSEQEFGARCEGFGLDGTEPRSSCVVEQFPREGEVLRRQTRAFIISHAPSPDLPPCGVS